MGHLWSGFNSYSIIDGFAESLFAPKIFSVVWTETWPSRNDLPDSRLNHGRTMRRISES